MSRPRRQLDCPRDPIGLSSEAAAAFLGVSQGTFLAAVEKKLLPEAHQLLGRMVWDADELAEAFKRLPRRGGAHEDAGGGVDWADVAA